MSILIFILIVLVVLALALYAVGLLPMIEAPFKQLIRVVLVVIAIVVICQRAGVL